MATLKQVADLAGVSPATASLALNNGPVNEKTRLRVIACAKKLNYVPNKIGKSLTTGKSHTIELLLLTSEEYTNTVHNTSLLYYIFGGVLSVLERENYTLRYNVKAHEDPSLTAYFERLVGDRSLDGIIVIPRFMFDYPFLTVLQQSEFPYVMLRPKRFGEMSNYVDTANDFGAGLICKLFQNNGYESLALINGPRLHIDAIERERGFVDAFDLKQPSHFIKKYSDFTIQGGYKEMDCILQSLTPDAVFCTNDYMAAGAMKCLLEAGLKIPGDVAIVGYDNNDIVNATSPSLTTVDNHFYELGQTLAEGLLSLIDGKATSINNVVEPTLIRRQSHG